MPPAFWSDYIVKLAIVAAVLAILYALARKLRHARLLPSGRSGFLTVVESRLLSQHATIHVVRAGRKYFLIGTATAAIATLGELEATEIDRTEP